MGMSGFVIVVCSILFGSSRQSIPKRIATAALFVVAAIVLPFKVLCWFAAATLTLVLMALFLKDRSAIGKRNNLSEYETAMAKYNAAKEKVDEYTRERMDPLGRQGMSEAMSQAVEAQQAKWRS